MRWDALHCIGAHIGNQDIVKTSFGVWPHVVRMLLIGPVSIVAIAIPTQ
jgi:hypothetical protein